jgi:hypothetical protein
MTTLVLQTAGQAIGGMIGGPFGEIVGRAVGSLAGAAIDNALFSGGARTVTGPRLREMDGLSASEGQPIPRLYGRVRVGGQLIWATRFEEELVTTVRKARGAKGGGGQKVREQSYSYFANLAIAVGEGPISFIRRVWADGRELDLSAVTHRIHRGGPDQQPDPLIVAKEGAANAPAYRGVAYVVFERLALADYGNRVPQFAFEVVRATGGLPEMIRAVNLIPGASEFAYDPARVLADGDLGAGRPENRQQFQAESDVLASLDQLEALCPQLQTVNLVVSWFGDDLRAGHCKIAPRVDNAIKTTPDNIWAVAGLTRASATLTTQIDGRAAYGGTPNDASVIALIGELKRRGLKVALYPFIMMDVPPGNALPNPYGGAGQPAFPWRGRITCDPAPGMPASVDATAVAAAQVAAFVGTVTPADITVSGGAVSCAKPNEWSYRRHILHHAGLALAAGGVDAFIIGTELVGLTRVRSASGVYPFVQALVGVAGDVRAMLGPATRLTYAADWTEYGAHVLNGGAEVRFPLDPLWASPAIDAVGVDYYAPISDWRDGLDHLDAGQARGPHDPAYLAARQRSGEAFDWFYATAGDRAAQARQAITDGAFGKPWMFRPKDLAGWWSNPHRERVGGVEQPNPTAWAPGVKPIWLTEIGCPAVDKGANSPNIFPDPRSSEGGYPAFSSGRRDDLMQARALEAQIGVMDPASPWFDAAANPARSGGGRMIAPADMAVWAWDARPFPAFPRRTDVWRDGEHWRTGHWLNGRLEAQPLDRLIAAILADFGLPAAARLGVDAMIDGYVIDRPMSAREALEPLTRLFGLDARFGPDGLTIAGRDARAALALDPQALAVAEGAAPYDLVRGQESELPREVRVVHLDSDDDNRRAVSRSRRLAGAARREATIEAAVAMPADAAERIAEERLREAWVARESITFALSPRDRAVEIGDSVSLPIDGEARLFRVTRITEAETRVVTAVAAAQQGWTGGRPPERLRRQPVQDQAGRPFAVLLELPAAREAEPPLLFAAACATPWPGPMTVLSAGDGQTYAAVATLERPALIGRLELNLPAGPLWRWDRAGVLDVTFSGGLPQSVTEFAALAGANNFAVQGGDGAWEIVSAQSVALVGPRRCRLTGLLRGLAGSEAEAGRVAPAGSLVVALDEALAPVERSVAAIGRNLAVKIAPPGVDLDDPTVVTLSHSVRGLALRPLAPVHPRARRNAGGVTIAWVRRTRRDGDSWDLADVPLAEDREAYRVRVLTGPGPAATVAWESEATRADALFPAAVETAVFGAAQTSLAVEITQVSAVVGPGAATRALLPIG